MKVDGSMQSLLQGVSQQPMRDRLPGQCTEQINMLADPVSGLSRRPPSDLVGTLGFTSDTDSEFYNFAATDGRKFLLWVHGDDVDVFDFNGTVIPVTYASTAARDYISAAGALRFCNVDNDVYISNAGKTCAMTADLTTSANAGPGSNASALIQILGGQYGVPYTIRYNGALAAMYTPPDGSFAAMSLFTSTAWIAEKLVDALTTVVSNPGINGTGSNIRGFGTFSGPEWEVLLQEDVILIRRTDGVSTPFNIALSDGRGNVNVTGFTDNTKDTSKLVTYAPHGYSVRIATETDSEEDAYFKYIIPGETVNGAGFGKQGYWQETTKPGIPYKINAATMPVILKYNASLVSFTLDVVNWVDRRIGTDTSNPYPSFIGLPITDITTFQGRLVTLCGKNVCMSTSDDIRDFWFSSATQVIDTDPVDVSSTSAEANIMQAAVPFNKDLVIFSPRGQFVIFGRTALTSLNASLVLSTAFEADLRARPVGSGRNVFFATRNGRYTNIREFYTESSGGELNSTRSVSQHVKKYKVGRARHLVSSSNYDKLLVLTDTAQNTIYLYEYIWSDTQKEQAAWSKWKFEHDVIFAFFDNALLYVICKFGTEFYMYRLSLDITDAPYLDFPVHLDGIFDVGSVSTQFVLPADRLASMPIQIVRGADCPNPGMEVAIQSIVYSVDEEGYIVTLSEDMEGGSVFVGVRAPMTYVPTMPSIKDSDGVAISTGNLVIKNFLVSLENTGHLIAQVKTKLGNKEPVVFEGRILGDAENIVGVPAVIDTTLVVPFRSKTSEAWLEFTTDEYLPVSILDIEWVGQYSKSGKRISGGT